MAPTTIKIDSAVRDRLNAMAAERGCSAGGLVEQLLDEHLWRQEVDRAVQLMSGMTPEQRAEYAAEAGQWDAASADGLQQW